MTAPPPSPSQHNRGGHVRVGVLGHGSIGSIVAAALADGKVEGAVLGGVALRSDRVGDDLGYTTAVTAVELLACDIIVEAAGPAALAAHGPGFLEAGRDVVAVSSGALIDDDVFASLTTAGPGRLHLCSGAIGGIDMICAAAAMGPIERATITSTKRPAGYVQAHMSPGEVSRLRGLTERTVLFEGPVRELVARFPSSTNVAATLALAIGSWEAVTGAVCADPAASHTTHVVEVTAAAGRYRFEMTNNPSPTNPRSSQVVPWAVVRALRELCGTSWGFI